MPTPADRPRRFARLARRLSLAIAVALAFGAPLGAAPPVLDPSQIDAMPMGPSPQERIDEIRRKVQKALVYPPQARRRGISGTSRIQFAIDAEGQPIGVTTIQSSGSRLLDRAAVQSARDAAPLPFLYGTLRIPVVFDLERY